MLSRKKTRTDLDERSDTVATYVVVLSLKGTRPHEFEKLRNIRFQEEDDIKSFAKIALSMIVRYGFAKKGVHRCLERARWTKKLLSAVRETGCGRLP